MHLLYIVSIDISIQKKKIAFIAMLHHFILSFLILFIYLQYARIDVKSTFNNFFQIIMAMKRTSLSFLTIIILILSSSCASLNQNSAKKSNYNSYQSKNRQPELRY